MPPSWIATYSGQRIDVNLFDPDTIKINDIAHALSHICRFSGHTSQLYTVAQHSVMVSKWCSVDNGLWGLLHDASEAYLMDIPSPIKRLLPDYQALEYRVMRSVAEAFDLEWPPPEEVHRVDRMICAVEVRDVMPWRSRRADDCPASEIAIHSVWPPEEAKELFLGTYEVLRRTK